MNPFKKEIIYIKTYENKVDLRHVNSGRQFKRESVNKFSNERLLIASVSIASAFLKEVLKEVFNNNLLDPKLVILIQPMEKVEGGISEVERMTFNDLVEQIGGKYVFVHDTCEELSDEMVKQITKTPILSI
ncbi:hypothetical protein SAMN05216290_0927 [Roseivirga pacifica]|uniref:Uncharacterized protein n=2 Tax=Roseivirga pacifica TaxID=1267423 RepID=A0A1I0N551_9BACT|nr:hypothetical protein SAMN05216290_0927 [Roseivirga pacifica]